MARLKKGAIPSYRLHKARNLAVVTIDGFDYYLGHYDTPASKQKYAALIRTWQERREQTDSPKDEPLRPTDQATINEIILLYLKYAEAYYKPNHGENKEAGCISDALAVLQELYARERADTFRPKDLKRVREAMIRKNWSRRYVNHQINRIKRMFGYAVEEDLVAGSTYHALLAVKGLKKGTAGVRETKKVRPVPIKHVKPVLKKAHAVLKAMLLFAYRTGARPGEICALKPCHLEHKKKVWVYRVPPDANKTDVHDQERKVFIGPRAQKILEPWLKELDPNEYVFSPRRAEALRHDLRRKNRKTPLWASHMNHQEAKRKASPKRAKRDHYAPTSFRRAVKRLCKSANVPAWTPNQLRHNAATIFRKRYGLEVARILLGHRKIQTTEIYAELDDRKVSKAALDIG